MLPNSTAWAYCQNILPRVSRTFAIGINSLKGELRTSILLGYLFCRIIDTVEDDPKLSANKKKEYLDLFCQCFLDVDKINNFIKECQIVTGDPHHIDLVSKTDLVFEVFKTLPIECQNSIKHWVQEMAIGMALFSVKYPQGLRIQTLQEYKEYCYFVAGTVGHLLTDLWIYYGKNISKNSLNHLKRNATAFGEALQSVNILKDISWDANQENAIYIPEEILKKHSSSHAKMFQSSYYFNSSSAIKEIIFLTEHNILFSVQYIKYISIRNFKIRFFCILPLLLATATLKKLKQSSNILQEKQKITRGLVKRIYIYSLLSSCHSFILGFFVKFLS